MCQKSSRGIKPFHFNLILCSSQTRITTFLRTKYCIYPPKKSVSKHRRTGIDEPSEKIPPVAGRCQQMRFSNQIFGASSRTSRSCSKKAICHNRLPRTQKNKLMIRSHNSSRAARPKVSTTWPKSNCRRTQHGIHHDKECPTEPSQSASGFKRVQVGLVPPTLKRAIKGKANAVGVERTRRPIVFRGDNEIAECRETRGITAILAIPTTTSETATHALHNNTYV